MDTNPLLDPLVRALNQSQALLSLAHASDWDSFETLVQQRQQGLLSIHDTEYLESLAQANLETSAAEIIQEIQEINKRLSVLASASRDQIASELRQSYKASKAVDAYSR